MKPIYAFVALLIEDVIAGFLFGIMYNWFVPEIFKTPAIHIYDGVPIMILISFLAANKQDRINKYESVTMQFLYDVIVYIIIFIIAFFIKCIFGYGLII